ncbi:hypothetical protein [Tardiphaga sp.]|uniref:hypothetical protein n=1 Tax=Tardiphaga sp. TaxID=1926292 RepID=UPI00262B1B7A|nr:hypothetical protein [Tardiphaga sp.]
MAWGLTFLLLGGSVAAVEILPPQAFTERFAQALGAAEPSASVAVRQELRLTVRTADGNTNDINLTNIYGEYRGQPERFDDLVQLFARAVRDPVPAKLQLSRVVPMIKDRGWLAEIAPIFRSRGHEPLFEPLNKELVIAYVEDSSTRARYLNTGDEVGDRNTLRARAIGNLKRILPKIEMRPHEDGWASISAGGNYEPSLLLIDEMWSTGQIKVDGDVVIAVPGRDALLVTGSNNRAGLKAMRAMAEKLATAPYRLTKALFVYREGRFVAFDPN